jgi:steroid delta-isomerase-like uncharacterized protein
MTPDDNKAAVRRFFDDVINAGHLDRADDFVTATYLEHQELPGAEGRQGIDVAKAFLSAMRVAFPDYRFVVEDLIGGEDKVVARVTVTGTHQGEMMGLAPTYKPVRTTGIEVFRLEDGKLAEHWATFDALGMLRQLGMVPVPKPPLLLRILRHQLPKFLQRRRSGSADCSCGHEA